MEYEEDQDEEQEGEIGSTGPTHDADPLPNTNSARPNKLPSPADAPPRKSRYRECLKNHAVGIGGHAVDGCGEFIPAGEDGTLESLRCAACNCHRNFHRKDPGGGAASSVAAAFQHQLLLTHPHHGHHYRGPSGYLHVPPPPPPQRAALLALPSSSGGGGAAAARDVEAEDYYYHHPNNNNNNNNSNNVYSPMMMSGSSGKKRFRTKFTQDQKDRMLGFAERLGWKIQKTDEETVAHFCEEVGIKRHVLKVWMHNNKHTLGKKT